MRRIIITILLLLLFITVKAQQLLKNPVLPIDSIRVLSQAKQAPKKQPVIMVDSIQIPVKQISLWNTNEIKDINVTRNAKYPDGVIYITSKDHQQFLNFLKSKKLSLKDLTNKYVPKADNKKPILYLMNGALLTDTTDVAVIADRYFDVKITKANETHYFKSAMPNILIMSVSTVMQITIRGNEENIISSLFN